MDPFTVDPANMMTAAGAYGPQDGLGAPTPWQGQFAPTAETRPIDRLRPESQFHQETLTRLMQSLKFGEDAVRAVIPRWEVNEMKLQAYVRLPDYERMLQMRNRMGMLPEPIKIVVPYTYATTHAATTYIAGVLFGRRPVFPMDAVAGSRVQNAQHLEAALQYNWEYCRGTEVGFQHVWDSLVYGRAFLRNRWTEKWGKGIFLSQGQRLSQEVLKYAGNEVSNADPYNTFPDPRVPLWQSNRLGDFVWFRSYQSALQLYTLEQDGQLRWVDAATKISKRDNDGLAGLNLSWDGNQAGRNRSWKIGNSNIWRGPSGYVDDFLQVDEGVVRLIPTKWHLGDGTRPELWKFTVIGKKQIVQAEPLGMEHDMLPFTAAEPTSMGYEFDSLASVDFLHPFQDLISWLLNSRMENVRSTLMNQFVADPARIEMQDLRNPAVGKVIRLKKNAAGMPIDQVIQALNPIDVTQSHLSDLRNISMLGDSISGVTDTMRGTQQPTGRRSATESRQAVQSGASRLGALAVRISAQSLGDLSQQMSINTQQFMPDQMWINLLGDDEQARQVMLTPEHVVGSFAYRTSDGTLPVDKMALVEVWERLTMGVAQDPELRQTYSVPGMFGFLAELSGARNLNAFRIQKAAAQNGVPMGQEVMQDDQLQQQVQAGNVIPFPRAA